MLCHRKRSKTILIEFSVVPCCLFLCFKEKANAFTSETNNEVDKRIFFWQLFCNIKIRKYQILNIKHILNINRYQINPKYKKTLRCVIEAHDYLLCSI